MNLRFLWAPNTRHCVSNDYRSRIPSESRVWGSLHGIIYREKPLGNGRQEWCMPRQESIIRLIEAGCCLWIFFFSIFFFRSVLFSFMCVHECIPHVCECPQSRKESAKDPLELELQGLWDTQYECWGCAHWVLWERDKSSGYPHSPSSRFVWAYLSFHRNEYWWNDVFTNYW